MMVSGAGSAPARSRIARSFAALHREVAGNLAGAAEDRLADHRRRDHLVVEHDGERPADVLLRHLGEAPRAVGVEAEGDDRLAGALVEAGLRVGQVLARHQDALLDQIGLRCPRPWCRAAARIPAARGPAAPARPASVWSTMRNVSLAVLPSSSLSRDGSCRPGTCTRMRSTPWRWIDGSTVPSSLTRRSTIWIDCSTAWRMRSMIAGSVGVSRISAAAGVDHVDRALAGGAEQAAERLRQLAQLGQRQLTVDALADAELDGVAADRRRGRAAEPVLAHHAAHVVAQRLDLLLAHRVGVDLEQDVRAALQVEAEHDVALRPFRPGLHDLLGQEIRHREQADDERREQDRQCLPARNVQHGLGASSRIAGSDQLDGALLLHRLALGAHVGHHRAHLPHAHAVGDLDLDLVVVDHLGDLADQPAGGDDGVAAAHVLDHLLVLLHPLLLRPQDQEIHDDEDQDERQQRHQHVVAAERRAGLAQMRA